jgi:hypothetical protein
VLLAVETAEAATFYVDDVNGSDTNNCTQAAPCKTINRGLNEAAIGGMAGDTVIVKSATYREEVVIPGSGASGNPFVLMSEVKHGAVIDGSDDYSTTAQWSQVGSSNTWLTSGVTSAPNQVFVNGLRLTPSTAAAGQMPINTYQYAAGTGLYINAGTGTNNPGSNTIQVSITRGAGSGDGIRADQRNYITIDGFAVARVNRKGIFMRDTGGGTCLGVIIKNNNVLQSNEDGIKFEGCQSGTILNNWSHDNKNHGVVLAWHAGTEVGSDNTTVDGNVSYNNGYKDNSATGFRVENSTNVTFQNNVAYWNQDSGFEAVVNASSPQYINNRSFKNGQHGFDHNSASGARHVNDVAWGNTGVGFNFENSPSNANHRLYNSASTHHQYAYNLQVGDHNSSVTWASDYNLYFNTSGDARIRWCTGTPTLTCTTYVDLSTFVAATPHEDHGTEADPLFANAFGGDLMPQLTPSASPLIDKADSSVTGWSNTDALGNNRFDQSCCTGGSGPTPYGDRGALETQN